MFEPFQACFGITCKLRINVKNVGLEPGCLTPPGLSECCVRSASGVAHVGKHVGVDVQTIGLEKTAIVVDEAHVLLPVPVGARIGMAIDPAAGAGGTAWYFRVGDYVLAVYGDLILLAAPRRKPRRSMIHAPGKPVRVVYVARVLDADAVFVGVPPTGVPGDVLVAHTLRYPAFTVGDVVRRPLGGAVLKPAYSAGVGTLCDVDNDLEYIVGALPLGLCVIAKSGRMPCGLWVVGDAALGSVDLWYFDVLRRELQALTARD